MVIYASKKFWFWAVRTVPWVPDGFFPVVCGENWAAKREFKICTHGREVRNCRDQRVLFPFVTIAASPLNFHRKQQKKKKPLAPRVSARSTSRPYVRPPLHVSGCEMAHLNTWYWTSMLWSIDICPKSICWPVSHDCIACLGIQLMEVMLFLKFSADQLFVFNWSWAEVNFFKGRIQFAPCLRPKYN